MKKFNKDKYLKKLKLKRFWQNNSRYFYIGVPCILCGILGIYFAYSKFFVTQEDAVVQTSVGNFVYGDVIINNYVNGQYTVEAPAKGSGYKVDKIVCDNGATATWDSKDWGPTITNVTRRSKCNIYFVDVEKINIGNVAVPLDAYELCPTVNEDGSVNVTAVEATNGYLCKAKDAYGDSYYYRGNVTNNYVKFADKYWRIVRINGDGTVRVIYDGTSAHTNGESSEDRQIGTSAFNSSKNDNAYVGYMYGKIGASTYADAHANTNDSTIKAYIDNWYKTNIVGTTNEQYLADNIFCNDRSFSTRNSGTGAGMSETYYRWYYFASSSYNNKMMLTCPQKNDAFTVSDTTNGNGALMYPAGLLSADEIVMAGGWNVVNSGYYLFTGQIWWTSSPRYFLGGEADVHYVYLNGNADYDDDDMYYDVWVRPVFNLKAEVLAQGSGTASDPYHLAS
mgnify:CR=1 FL=1